jgi:shikimate dehydrogenase
MNEYWIIGHPLSFALTTPVMNGMFDRLGFGGNFQTKNVSPEELGEAMEKVRRGELAGLVTTMPHKTPSIAYLQNKSDSVQKINAVNLILPCERTVEAEDSSDASLVGANPGTPENPATLCGHNTDWKGAQGAVKSAMPNLEGKHALVLGAGGAARAAAYGLKEAGAIVSIWNRTPERAKAFAEKLEIQWVEDLKNWASQAKPQLIINATSISYQSKQSSLVPFPLWEKVELALDAVYGNTSLFLEEAKAAQVEIALSGEHWFLHQFLPMFKVITGQDAPPEFVIELIKEAQRLKDA